MTIKKIIDNFLYRNKKSIRSSNVIYEMNGIILNKSCDKDFDFKSMVIHEVQQHCKENGIKKIDKVVIMSVYDADLHNLNKKIVFNQRTISNSENKIVVIKEKNKVIAQVIFSEYVEISGDN